MNCPCDDKQWPLPLAIVPGLHSLPRQLFDFAGMRTAMFDRMRTQPALAKWTARDRSDWGVMLLELWAYAGEILSIYDKAIADESYVRTSVLRPSLRRLVELLGYLPRPAVAPAIELGAIADGVRPVVLPVRTAFRSGPFDGQPPQVFELVHPATIHPALNRWELAVPISSTVPGTFAHLLFDPATLRIGAGDVVLVEISDGYEVYARKIEKVERVVDEAGRRAMRVIFDREIVHASSPIPLEKLRVLRSRRIAPLKSPSGIDSDPPSFDPIFNTVVMYMGGVPSSSAVGLIGKYQFILDGVYPEARKDTLALAQRGDDLRFFRIDHRFDDRFRIQPDGETPGMSFETPDGTVTVDPQPIGPLTQLYTVLQASTLLAKREGISSPDRDSWKTSVAPDELVVHVGFESAGRVLGAPRSTIEPGDPLIALDTRAPISTVATTSRILLRDAEANGVAIDGDIDFASSTIDVGPEAWWPPLAAPVEAFGNVITAVRGESVLGEVIGAGNAALAHQTFTLAKKPLTYVPAPKSPTGLASTLRVWVDGLEWFEVPTLFGQPATAQVFTVRLDDDEVASVIFGDGTHGSRIATGASVVASYRFGAGAAKPPGGSVTQIARPVVGLRSIVGPVGATGGADREPASALRTLAPRSAMLLGRAISIDDMEVAALGVPGVITARAEWQWDGKLQRPVVKVWVVGDSAAPAAVTSRLRGLSDPSTPIRAEAATPLATPVTIDLEIDPRRIADDVLAEVRVALAEDALSLPVLGIGRPVVRSRLVTALLDMQGVTGVRGITWGGVPMLAWAVDPGVGAYFDLGAGPTVTGS
jgi:hypothetical protein